MMQEQKTATLTTIFSEVLANLAFMFTEDEQAEPSPGDLWFETTISYTGPHAGTLRLHCPAPFAKLLAANLLGVELNEDDGFDEAEDAVKEFMNIVCGQLVTAMHGCDDVFNLTIPEVRHLIETPDLSGQVDGDVARLCVDGYLVQLICTCDGES
ncbi:MAG: chemotaxis protein CheX [Planctomycetota bacterium]